VSNRRGLATLRVGANTATGSIATGTHRDGIEEFEVDTLPLDAVRRDAKLGAIDLLKIDVEGSEIAVLDGANATLGACTRVVIEVTSPAAIAEVTERLTRAGFTRIRTRQGGADSGAPLVYADRT
jgi:hypothetical protein